MRILLICQYFPPEMGAPSARTYEHARQWVLDGHKVTVLTGLPNHPTGIVPPEYRGKLFYPETLDGITVWRTWLYAVPNVGFFRRACSYFSFMLSTIVTAAFRPADYDVVIATSPQLLVAGAGYLVSRIKRKPLVLEIRDLWPASLVAVGLLKAESPIVRMLECMEKFLYHSACCIIVVTESFRSQLIRRGVNAHKIHTIHNGVDLTHFSPGPRDNEFRQRYASGDTFVAAYIGTHGMAQRLSTIMDAAAQLRHQSRIRFLFVGEGAEKAALKKMAQEKQLDNVMFLDQQPKEKMPLLLNSVDACLVPLRKDELFKTVIPSKIFEIMACGRPLVLGVEGEAKQIITEAGAGLTVKPDNPAQLEEAVIRLADDPDLTQQLGRAGRAYVQRYFDRRTLARRMIEAIRATVSI